MDTPHNAETNRPDTATELRAAVEARKELGPDMEDHVIEAFLARIQSRVDSISQSSARPVQRPNSARNERVQVEIVAGSLALAIPLMAIAGGIAGGIGVFCVVFGVVAINLLYFIDRWVRMNLS